MGRAESLLSSSDASWLTPKREIHPLDPQPHRHSMLVPRVCAPRFTRCSLGKYWSRDFFQKEAESSRQGVGDPEPYLFSLPLSRSASLPRRWGQQAGVHRLSMTHVWEAAKFDDACTVPTPCLLLSASTHTHTVMRMYLHNGTTYCFKGVVGCSTKSQLHLKLVTVNF